MGRRNKRRNKRNRKGSKIIVRREGVEVMKKTNKPSQNSVFGLGRDGYQTVKGVSVNPSPCGNVNGRPMVPGVVYHHPTPQPSFWETDIEVATVATCGAFSDKIKVSVSPQARAKMNLLMNRFKTIEWLAYLVGDKETYTVDDIVIPKQRVTSVNVYVDEPVDVPIIGVIHSHHDMGNNFSHTDDEYINQNHDISLCISNSGIKGQARVKTECGRFFLADVEVVDNIIGFEPKDFLKDVDELIKPVSFAHHTRSNPTVAESHYAGFGNSAGWDGLPEVDDTSWDTESGISIDTSEPRDVIGEIDRYRVSLAGIHVDESYKNEFEMLSTLIDTINTPEFEIAETAAFHMGQTYTEEYFSLIDELSLYHDALTPIEHMNLRALSTQVKKMIEVSNLN